MTKALIPFFILLAQFLFSQNHTIKLDHFAPEAAYHDLSRIDSYLENRRLIGLGESTHGTHEFFKMRHRLIQYLVENHSVSIIFMEADFANSLMIDEYIKGKGGNAKEAVKDLQLWPWTTEEMVDLVEYLKLHNESNQNNQVSFVGVDVQKIDRTVSRLERLIEKYGLPTRDDKIVNATEFFGLSKKEALDLRSVEIDRYEKVDISNFTAEDKYEYHWLSKHLNQILSEKLEKKSHQNIYRDKMMALNILDHLKVNNEIKGVFWAHNGHIANLFTEKKNRGVAGGFLKKSLGRDYFIIGQEFDSGSFNARVKPVEYSKNYSNWQLTNVEVGESPDGSFAANHRSISDPIIFVPFDQLPESESVYINTIGAIYYTNKEGEESEFLRRNHHGRESFDAIILFKKSTPTKLLK